MTNSSKIVCLTEELASRVKNLWGNSKQLYKNVKNIFWSQNRVLPFCSTAFSRLLPNGFIETWFIIHLQLASVEWQILIVVYLMSVRI